MQSTLEQSCSGLRCDVPGHCSEFCSERVGAGAGAGAGEGEDEGGSGDRSEQTHDDWVISKG